MCGRLRWRVIEGGGSDVFFDRSYAYFIRLTAEYPTQQQHKPSVDARASHVRLGVQHVGPPERVACSGRCKFGNGR